jgi:hypothetical protein
MGFEVMVIEQMGGKLTEGNTEASKPLPQTCAASSDLMTFLAKVQEFEVLHSSFRIAL